MSTTNATSVLMRATLVVVAMLASSTGAHAATEDARLRDAYALAKKRETGAAIDAYRALLADGVDGAGVHYNLGTLCLDAGDVGCAVLHLRAAALLDPRDDDVQHNLALALDARTDRLGGAMTGGALHAFGSATPPLLARLALAVPLALLGVAFAWLALDRARRFARTFAVVSGALVAAGGPVYACRLAAERVVTVVVLSDETPALKEPDDDAAVAFTAHAGLAGERIAEEGAYVRVRFDNGLDAWLTAAHTGTVP